MSLADLIPLVDNLSESDKLALLKRLAVQVPNSDLQMIFSAAEYPVYSQYDAHEAAAILMQMIHDNQIRIADV